MVFISNEKAAKRIKSFRAVAGLTQAEMAEKLGVTTKVYSRYENDPYSVPVAKLVPLAEQFGCSLGDFFVDMEYSK